MKGCEEMHDVKPISKKAAMKEMLKELAGQMFEKMQSGKGEAPMAKGEVKEAMEAMGEGAEDPMMEAMAGEEKDEEGIGRPRPKMMEISAIKMGLLKPQQMAQAMAGEKKKGRKA